MTYSCQHATINLTDRAAGPERSATWSASW
nr:MAG TPA: hypothetical protein [Caudoviricetes sp.]